MSPPTHALRALAVMVAGWCMLAVIPARAAQPSTSDVEKLIKRGNELRSARKDHEALPHFQEAYELAPTPRTAAQLGLCEMALNYWLAADGHLSEALASRGDWIDRNRATIQSSQRMVQKQIGEIIVGGTPVGASVSFNGRKVGTLPLTSVRVVAGPLRVDLTAPGYKDRSESVVVAGETQKRLTVHLERQGGIAEAHGPPTSIPSRVQGRRSSAPNAEAPPWSTGKVAGATLLGAGTLSVAGGATMLLFDKRESCDSPAEAHCSRRINTSVPAWTLIGVGVAVGALGGFLIYNSSSAQVTAGVTPSSILVAVRF